jgi:pyruvate carboxylase subunit A
MDVDETVDIADSIGDPVILKAYAGGGGIGMKTVYEVDELLRTIEST